MTKTIAILPARGNSKRLPGKNIKVLNGFPLVVHSILYAQKHACIDEVYVSTDDFEIKEIAIKYGAKVVDRPSALSGDFEPTVSALKHVLESIEGHVENVVLLQPTNPLRPADLLENAFKVFQAIKADSLFTVSRNQHKLGKITNDKFIPYNYKVGQRSQELEPLYYENGLLYISKATAILKDEIITTDAYPFEVDHPFAAVDIDTQEDFEYAEYLYNKFITLNS